MPAEQTQEQTSNASSRWKGKVVIELGDDRNRMIVFGPTKEKLRGRWDKANLRGDEVTEQMEYIPTIPGLHIELDGRKRQARIYDPLTLPQYKRTLEQARKGHRHVLKRDAHPDDERVKEKMTDTDIKTWLYHMRRLVDGTPPVDDPVTGRTTGGPQAHLVEGTLPSYEEIEALPGKTGQEFYNSSSKRVRWREDVKKEGE